MKKKLSIVLVIVLVFALFTGCAAKSEAADMAAPMSPEFSGTTADKSEGFYGDYVADMPVDAPAEEPMPETEGAVTSPAGSALQTNYPNTKLIFTADIEMETTEFDAAVKSLDALVEKLGGYYEQRNVNNYSTYRDASYIVRIPAENFNAFCELTGENCKVNSINRRSEDISEVYYDTEARLTTQETKLKRLQELLSKAENMEDIITIESEISETELMIENLTGSLRKYDSLVGFSTVAVYLNEVYKLSDAEEPVIGFGAKLAAAFRRGCTNFVDGLENMLLGFARAWVGWLIFFAVAAVVVILVVRKVRRIKAKRAEKKAAKEDENKKEN